MLSQPTMLINLPDCQSKHSYIFYKLCSAISCLHLFSTILIKRMLDTKLVLNSCKHFKKLLLLSLLVFNLSLQQFLTKTIYHEKNVDLNFDEVHGFFYRSSLTTVNPCHPQQQSVLPPFFIAGSFSLAIRLFFPSVPGMGEGGRGIRCFSCCLFLYYYYYCCLCSLPGG